MSSEAYVAALKTNDEVMSLGFVELKKYMGQIGLDQPRFGTKASFLIDCMNRRKELLGGNVDKPQASESRQSRRSSVQKVAVSRKVVREDKPVTKPYYYYGKPKPKKGRRPVGGSAMLAARLQKRTGKAKKKKTPVKKSTEHKPVEKKVVATKRVKKQPVKKNIAYVKQPTEEKSVAAESAKKPKSSSPVAQKKKKTKPKVKPEEKEEVKTKKNITKSSKPKQQKPKVKRKPEEKVKENGSTKLAPKTVKTGKVNNVPTTSQNMLAQVKATNMIENNADSKCEEKDSSLAAIDKFYQQLTEDTSLVIEVFTNPQSEVAQSKILENIRTQRDELYHEFGEDQGRLLSWLRDAILKVEKEAPPEDLTSPGHGEFLLASSGFLESMEDHEGVLRMRKMLLDIFVNAYGDEHQETFIAQNNIAVSMDKLGRHEEALELYEDILEKRLKQTDETDINVIHSRSNLAACLVELGRWEEATKVCEDVIATKTKNTDFGASHESTLLSQSLLASLYVKMAQFAKAIHTYEEILKVQMDVPMAQKSAREKCDDVLETKSGLAVALKGLGKYDDALKLLGDVLAIQVEKLGDKHSNTLVTKIKLAGVYEIMGNTEKAMELNKAVVEARQGDDGGELTSKSHLALSLQNLGRLEEAQAMEREVLDECTKKFGPDHVSTLTSKNNLALCLDKLGKHSEADKLHLELCEARERLLGPNHADTLMAKDNLGTSYRVQGMYEDALKLHEEVLKGRCVVYADEPEHPQILHTKNSMAYILRMLERKLEASELYKEIATNKTLGPDHPNTITFKNGLVVCLIELEKWQEAAEMQKELVNAKIKALGEENDEVLTAKQALATTLVRAGDKEAGLEIMQDIMAYREKKLGPEHPTTIAQKRQISIILGQLDKREEAVALLNEVVETLMKTSGASHPDTIALMEQIVMHLTHLGKNDEAVKIQTEVVEAKTKLYGDGNRATLSAKRNLGVILGNLGRFKEAVDCMDEAAKVAEEQLGKDDALTVAMRSYLDQLQTRLKAMLKNSLQGK